MIRSGITFVLLLLAIFAVNSYGQAIDSPIKFAFIDSEAFFDDLSGIPEIVNAKRSVDAEFATEKNRLTVMRQKVANLQYELRVSRTLRQSDPIRLRVMNDEVNAFQQAYESQQKDITDRYDNRYNAVVGPVIEKIRIAVKEFAEWKGFSAIFDISKLQWSSIITGGRFENDVTDEFIAYFNTRQIEHEAMQ